MPSALRARSWTAVKSSGSVCVTAIGFPGRPSSPRRTRKKRMAGSFGSVQPATANVRLSRAAATRCQELATPGGSGMFATNAPVSASCTAGGTGVKAAVLESSAKWVSGPRAETKKRGSPVAARGVPVAVGSVREVAAGKGCRVGPAVVRCEGRVGSSVDDGCAAPTSDTRSAAGSAQPVTRTARAKPASERDAEEDIRGSSYGGGLPEQHSTGSVRAGRDGCGSRRRRTRRASRRGYAAPDG
ncbi:hypothetical protein ACFQYP_15715 [Nonomuraea antimicrobica]